MAISLEAAEQTVRQYLKETGRRVHFSNVEHVVVQAFLANDKPRTTLDVLYAVKKLDPMIGHPAVRRVLEILVNCGLARMLMPTEVNAPRQARRFQRIDGIEPEVSRQTTDTQPCQHHHLVCKDCGAAVIADHV